ncbi:beat protein, putative [Ixodes scapularis]|uniref:Beat protein, putative n=1 Tax=Ixodes scapularis TaxID=6945 RepID=B7P7L8_IXOSC|nr:beat protein, putative [Ixodes scapularis]|eukprot:XP_002399291.1 beat protein, putative [Ixodes scapularis]
MALYWSTGLFCSCPGARCIRILSLEVPQTALVGTEARLRCAYDLEGDVLYSVKWYRDDVEFFRFVPSDRPPGQFFPVDGIKVDVRTAFFFYRNKCTPR